MEKEISRRAWQTALFSPQRINFHDSSVIERNRTTRQLSDQQPTTDEIDGWQRSQSLERILTMADAKMAINTSFLHAICGQIFWRNERKRGQFRKGKSTWRRVRKGHWLRWLSWFPVKRRDSTFNGRKRGWMVIRRLWERSIRRREVRAEKSGRNLKKWMGKGRKRKEKPEFVVAKIDCRKSFVSWRKYNMLEIIMS